MARMQQQLLASIFLASLVGQTAAVVCNGPWYGGADCDCTTKANCKHSMIRKIKDSSTHSSYASASCEGFDYNRFNLRTIRHVDYCAEALLFTRGLAPPHTTSSPYINVYGTSGVSDIGDDGRDYALSMAGSSSSSRPAGCSYKGNLLYDTNYFYDVTTDSACSELYPCVCFDDTPVYTEITSGICSDYGYEDLTQAECFNNDIYKSMTGTDRPNYVNTYDYNDVRYPPGCHLDSVGGPYVSHNAELTSTIAVGDATYPSGYCRGNCEYNNNIFVKITSGTCTGNGFDHLDETECRDPRLFEFIQHEEWDSYAGNNYASTKVTFSSYPPGCFIDGKGISFNTNLASTKAVPTTHTTPITIAVCKKPSPTIHSTCGGTPAVTDAPTGAPTASPTGAPTASPTGAPTPAGAAAVDAEGQQKADYQQKFDATSTLNDAIAVTSDLGDETVAYDEVVEVALKELAAKTQAETMDTTQATNLVAAIAKVGAISEEYVQRTVTAVEVGKTANTLLGETLAVFQADAAAQVPFDGLIDVSSEVMESGGCDYLRSGTEKSEQAAYLQQARAPGGVSDYQTNMIKGASGTGDGTSQFSSTLGSVVIPAKSIEADSTQFSVHVIEPQQDWMKTCYENLHEAATQESKGSLKINSMLRISVTKADGAQKAITSLKTPFSFKLPVSADRATSGLTIEQEISCGKLQCQYYDPDTESFKSDGCTTKPHPDGGGALCECTHMTEFALISREQQECVSSAELPVWILLMVLYPFMSGLAARQLFMTLRVSHFKSHLLMNLTHTFVALWCMFRFINSFAWYKDAMELGARQILSMIALTLSTLCFAMLIAAWMYLSSAARGGKGSSALERYRVPIIVLGTVFVVVVMSMTFASASTSSQAPKQGAAVFVAVVVVAMGALFLVMGLRLYFKITTKNFKSKHARKVFLYAVAYAVCLGLECVIKLVSSFADTPDDATFQALIALDGLLDLSAAALIVLIFRRPVAQLVRKGKNLHSSALYASTQQSNSKVSYGAGNSARSRNKSVRSSRNAEKRAMKAGKLSYRINTVEVTPSPRPEETKTTLTGRSSIPEEPVTGRSRSSPMAEPADVNLHLSVSNPIADDDI